MALSPKVIRAQLRRLSPLFQRGSLELVRKRQNKIGELMEARYRRQILSREHSFDSFIGCWTVPKDERRQGVILYLHGGGYTCGDLEYAKGVAAMLAVKCGVRVFCSAYRLAPEHPYPSALEDALTSYRYLLDKGYSPEHITLCGESAGGGLCYALSLKLTELEMPQPCGIIAISPWTDLTSSGDSYEENRERDPSMTVEILDYYAECYTDDRKNPFVSPLFGDLSQIPPSLIFAGGDEIMLSDARDMHEKLLEKGRKSQLVVRPDRWHGYVLYTLAEDAADLVTINAFLNRYAGQENKLRWMRLDNAAKIYPATRRQNWSNVFRLSATLRDNVDREVMQSALDVTVRRFPSIAARLRRGAFWYYLQQLERAPDIQEENSYPLAGMSKAEMRKCALRVIVYQKRVAVEFFHSLTDGNGALVFVKTLIAEYLHQKHGLTIPAEQGVLGRLEDPSEEELEDSFPKYAGPVAAPRGGTNAWKPSGTPEPDGFLNITCLQLPVKAVLEKAHAYDVTLTTFLGACLMQALQNLQKEKVPDIRRRKHIKLLIPVNLRKLFPSRTLRNFVLYTIPEIDPRLGEYSFGELCTNIRHKMGLEINAKYMSKMIATNIGSEKLLLVKIMPLFIKNFVMKLVFNAVGERKSCLTMSNLGAVRLPYVMMPYVERFDFILGTQVTSPYNCGVLSFGDSVYVNFIRNIREPELEYHFFRVLRELGIPVRVESNQSIR